MDRDLLRAELVRDEGLRNFPYRDTVGVLTIGIGRNLEARGISDSEALHLLDNDLVWCEHDLDRNIPWWRDLTDARQRALVNMVFNLGWPRLAGFKNMLAALESGNYDRAAREALNSLWARQVGNRAERVADMIRNG